MAEKIEDFEVELPEEDSPIDVLNEPNGQDLFDYELIGDDSSDGIGDTKLKDMLPDNKEVQSEQDEEEIDLGMDEIGDLVEDLKLDIEKDETLPSEEGEEDMTFEEEESEDESVESVESLLDDLGEDESEEESEEISVSDFSSEEDISLDSSESEDELKAEVIENLEEPLEENGDDSLAEAMEGAEDSPAEAMEEAEDSPAEAMEEAEDSPAEVTEELEDTPAEVTEEVEDSPAEAMDEAEDSPSEGTEEDLESLSAESPEKSSEEVSQNGSVENKKDSVEEQPSDVLEMLHDPGVPNEIEGEDSKDLDLGMDAIDETKENLGEDLDIEETEIDESVAEEVGIVGSDKKETTEWFQDPEVESDTIEELEELNGKMDSLRSSDSVEVNGLNSSEDTAEIENSIESESLEETPSPLGSSLLLNFHHEVVVEIARTELTGEEITQITYGSIIELDKEIGEPVNLVLDGKTIAHGEVVQINKERLGIRIVGVVQE